jgi:heparanase 1
MGTTVLDCGEPKGELRVYAHRLRDRPDGMAVLALNTDRAKEQVLTLPVASERYTLTAKELQARSVLLNGAPLQLSPDGTLPLLTGEQSPAGTLHLPPASVTFLALAG